MRKIWSMSQLGRLIALGGGVFALGCMGCIDTPASPSRGKPAGPSHAPLVNPLVKQTRSILDAQEAELRQGQVKISYLGMQTMPVHNVLFSTEAGKVLLDPFFEIQPGHKPYGNDYLIRKGESEYEFMEGPFVSDWLSLPTFTFTLAEIHRVLTAIKEIVSQEDPNLERERVFLSVAVLCRRGAGLEGYDFHISRELADAFYNRLIPVLEPTNNVGRKALTFQYHAACGF